MNRKGQLSIETMIIYGLIILVTLSVIGVLIYFGVIDLGSYLPDKCDLGGTSDLKCEEWSFDASTHTLEIGIRNIGQKPVSLLTVEVEDSSQVHFSGPKSGTATYNGAAIDGSGQALPPGAIALVRIDTTTALENTLLRGTLKTAYRFTEGVIVQEAVGSFRAKAN